MINLPFDFYQALDVLLTILTVSLSLCFIRLYLGPTLPNRTLAFDSISIHAVAILAIYAIRIDAPSILDVALVVAILGFLGTTMMARYLERSAHIYYALIRGNDSEETELKNKLSSLERNQERKEAQTP